MSFYDPLAPPVVQILPRQNNRDLETVYYTTTSVYQQAVATSVPITDAAGSVTYSPTNVIEEVTTVETVSVLLTPSTTPALVSAQPTSSSISSSSSVVSVPSSSSTPPSSTILSSITSQSSGIAAANPSPVAENASQSGAAVPAPPSPPLPAGAIAGIVIGAVVLLNIVGVLLYRRHQLAKRMARRATWKAGIRAKPKDFSSIEKGTPGPEPAPLLTPFTLGMPARTSVTSAAGNRNSSIRHSIYNLPSALARTFPRDHFSPSRAVSPAMRTGGSAAPSRPARSELRPNRKTPPPVDESMQSAQSASRVGSAQVPTSLVRVTFIPTRPDELSISIGQTLAVLHHFDDGWALCANAYGEQGMVPLECLEGGGGQFTGFKDRSAMMQRSSKRASSLYPLTSNSARFA